MLWPSSAHRQPAPRSPFRRLRPDCRWLRPVVEALEKRCLLAGVIFLENFTFDDANNPPTFMSDQPGFDTALDGYHIQGGTGGNVVIRRIEQIDAPPPDPGEASPPHVLSIATGGYVAILPGVGEPGGLLDGEEIATAKVSVYGNGTVTFVGANGFLEVPFTSFADWQFVTATSGSELSSGERLGGITGVHVTSNFGYIDDVSVLIGTAQGTGPLRAFDVGVTTPPGVAVDIDASYNSDAPEVPKIVSVTAPSQGTAQIIFPPARHRIVYTPNSDYHGSDSFEYTIADSLGNSDMGRVIVQVNHVPVAVDDFPTVPHGFLEDFVVPPPGVRANDPPDLDGDPVIAVKVTDPLHGTVTLGPDGSYTYSPLGGSPVRADSFNYLLDDGFSNSNVATVHIRVPNEDPVAVNDLVDVVGDVPRGGTVLTNDHDPDGDPLTVGELVSLPVHGTLTLGPGDLYTYTPDISFRGIDMFSYRATDGIGFSNVATVVLDVTPGVPEARFDAYRMLPNQILVIGAPGILANDSSPLHRPLTPVLHEGDTNTPNGHLIPHLDGGFTYIPDDDFEGQDSFLYEVTDGISFSEAVHVYLSVSDDAPVAVSDPYSMLRDTLLTVTAPGLLANDSDGGAGFLGITDLSMPKHGVLTMTNYDGEFTYRPIPGFVGVDSFTYTVTNNTGYLDSSSVQIEVQGLPPVAAPLSYLLHAPDVMLASSAPGVLAGASDADGDVLTAVLVAGPARGNLLLFPDGGFAYFVDSGFVGQDSFQFQAFDGRFYSNVATVTIDVTNQRPVAAPLSYHLHAPDATLSVGAPGVLAGASDADGDALTARVHEYPSHGDVSLHPDGSFDYAVDPGFRGQDSFLFQVFDGMWYSEVAFVFIDVTNQRPVAAPLSYHLHAPDATLSVGAPGVLAGASDADGDGLTAQVINSPSHGDLSLHPDGSFDYSVDLGFVGPDWFQFRAFDGAWYSDWTTVTIDVTNEPPVAGSVSYRLPDGFSVVGAPGVLAGASDADGDVLTAVQLPGSAHGALSLRPDGSFDYLVRPGFVGQDSFQFQAFDGVFYSNVATLTIDVFAPDTDQDGVPDSVEDARPGGSDANNDGIPDSQQPNVVSLPDAAHHYVTLVGPAGTSFVNVAAVLPPALPPTFVSLTGFFTFELSGVAPGGSATVIVILPPGLRPNTYVKFGPTPTNAAPHVYIFDFNGATGVEIFGNLLVLHFVDGARGDGDVNDPISHGVNGVIVDPGGPVIVIDTPPEITSLTSSAPQVGEAREGQTVSIAAAFTDAGIGDPHTAVIDWGDGTTSPAIVTEAGGSGTISASHVYVHGGIYPLTLSVFDIYEQSDSETATAYITGVGLHSGVLQIVGTEGADQVTVVRQGHNTWKVAASFLAGWQHARTFPSAGITELVALLGSGNDTAKISPEIRVTALLDGGPGNDFLNGGGGPNILLGGAGKDTLLGGDHRDLIIGGLGGDRLIGQKRGDLLIGGITAFDNHRQALFAILAEWTAARDFATRVANISGSGVGPRLNGDFLLNPSTVFDDAAADSIAGNRGRDWLFARLGEDLLLDFHGLDLLTSIGTPKRLGKAKSK